MAELREREDEVLQGQVWATGLSNLGGSGIQRREVRINDPRLHKGAKAVLSVRDTTSGMDPFFFEVLRLEYLSIPVAILRSIIKTLFFFFIFYVYMQPCGL